MNPLETVNAFIAAIEGKDLDSAMALVHDDCEYDNVPMGKNHGAPAIRTVMERFLGPASAVRWTVSRESASGPIVFNERVDAFDLPHGTVALPVTGVWEVHDGLITLWRDYFDANMYLSQMPTRGGAANA